MYEKKRRTLESIKKKWSFFIRFILNIRFVLLVVLHQNLHLFNDDHDERKSIGLKGPRPFLSRLPLTVFSPPKGEKRSKNGSSFANQTIIEPWISWRPCMIVEKKLLEKTIAIVGKVPFKWSFFLYWFRSSSLFFVHLAPEGKKTFWLIQNLSDLSNFLWKLIWILFAGIVSRCKILFLHWKFARNVFKIGHFLNII